MGEGCSGSSGFWFNLPGGSMRQVGYINRIMAFFAVLLLCIASIFEGPRLVYGQEVLRGLNLSEVYFVLRAPLSFSDTLHARAMKQFSDAGLKVREEHMFPRIQLSLRPKEIEHCKDIEIYQPKLEFLEEVALVRSGHKRIATTWFYGQEFGYETKHLSLADLQKEQDEMLKVFIDQYKFLNPKK